MLKETDIRVGNWFKYNSSTNICSFKIFEINDSNDVFYEHYFLNFASDIPTLECIGLALRKEALLNDDQYTSKEEKDENFNDYFYRIVMFETNIYGAKNVVK